MRLTTTLQSKLRIKDLRDDERYRIRQAESLPWLQAFKTLLKTTPAGS